MVESAQSQAIESFARIDFFGCLGGIAAVIAINGLIVQQPGVWIILPFLLGLAGTLSLAQRRARSQPMTALALIAGGNWLVAIAVAALLPFLWPPMILTVLLPLVLATPFLERRTLRAAVLAAAVVTAVVGAIGLLNDDGGVVDDIDDTFEFVIVIGALGALTVPVALVIGQNNALQRSTISDLAASRRRVVEAADHERSRIERNLHDGAQQRLLALRMRLRLLEEQGGDKAAQSASAALAGEVDAAIEELRELAHGIYPPILASSGLSEALASVVRRSPAAVDASIDDVGRHDASMEAALYHTALEALTNTAKHAPGSRVDLSLRRRDATVELTVTDDGPGFDTMEIEESFGLTSMADRIESVGGVLEVSSTSAGVSVRAAVPVAPPSRQWDEGRSDGLRGTDDQR